MVIPALSACRERDLMAPSCRTTLVIPGSLAERLAEVADEFGYTQSEILRGLIRDYLDDYAEVLREEAEEDEDDPSDEHVDEDE